MTSQQKRRGRPPGIPNPNAGRPPLGRQPKRHISLRLNADILDQLDAAVQATGKSKAFFVEVALAAYLP